MTKGWGSAEKQVREGIVWDKWILLSTEIWCQILWKGLFTQPLKLLFTHSHTSSHRFQLSYSQTRVVCPGLCVCDAEDKGCRLSCVSQVLTGR